MQRAEKAMGDSEKQPASGRLVYKRKAETESAKAQPANKVSNSLTSLYLGVISKSAEEKPLSAPIKRAGAQFDYKEFFKNNKAAAERILGWLEKYYGHDESMARVQEFGLWFSKNYAALVDAFKQEVAAGHMNARMDTESQALQAFGFFIGGEYLAYKYQIPVWDVRAAVEPSEAFVSYLDGKLRLCPLEKMVRTQDPSQVDPMVLFLHAFNIGIHEHAHVAGGSEVMAYLAQHELGLPIKSADIEPLLIGYTVRDWRHIRSEAAGGQARFKLDDILQNEYFAMLCGPWIEQYYRGKDHWPNFLHQGNELELYIKDVFNGQKEDVYSAKTKDGAYSKTNDGPYFTYSSGIEAEDKELAKKLKRVIAGLKKMRWGKSLERFLDKFEKAMDKEFKKYSKPPLAPDLLPGYSYNAPSGPSSVERG